MDLSPCKIGNMDITRDHEDQFAEYTIRHFTVLKEVGLSLSRLSFLDKTKINFNMVTKCYRARLNSGRYVLSN